MLKKLQNELSEPVEIDVGDGFFSVLRGESTDGVTTFSRSNERVSDTVIGEHSSIVMIVDDAGPSVIL
jgi:hypothetical protein